MTTSSVRHRHGSTLDERSDDSGTGSAIYLKPYVRDAHVQADESGSGDVIIPRQRSSSLS